MEKEKKKKSIVGRGFFWGGISTYAVFVASPLIGLALPVFLAPVIMIGAVSMVGYSGFRAGNGGRKKIKNIRINRKINKDKKKKVKENNNKNIPNKDTNKASRLVLDQSLYNKDNKNKSIKRGK